MDLDKKIFDNELEGVLKYKKRNDFTPDSLLLPQIYSMNITVHERIKTIMVNMERSRWLSHDQKRSNL
jgi:murein L,D-transpeptidase YcbB/YkuD